MSLEQSIEKLTAAIEAATGVLVTQGAAGKATGAPAAAAAPAPRGPGRQAKGAAAPAPAPATDEGLDGGLGADDGGLGADDGGLGGEEAAISGEEAKKVVLAYRDKVVKLKGSEEGLNLTRQLMKKHVAALADISDDNAAEIHKTFTAALSKLK